MARSSQEEFLAQVSLHKKNALPEPNVALETLGLEDEFPLGKFFLIFRGYVSFREGNIKWC